MCRGSEAPPSIRAVCRVMDLITARTRHIHANIQMCPLRCYLLLVLLLLLLLLRTPPLPPPPLLLPTPSPCARMRPSHAGVERRRGGVERAGARTIGARDAQTTMMALD